MKMKQYVNPNCEIGHVSAAGGMWVDVDAEEAYGEMRTVFPQPGTCRLDDPLGGCGQVCFERSNFVCLQACSFSSPRTMLLRGQHSKSYRVGVVE